MTYQEWNKASSVYSKRKVVVIKYVIIFIALVLLVKFVVDYQLHAVTLVSQNLVSEADIIQTETQTTLSLPMEYELYEDSSIYIPEITTQASNVTPLDEFIRFFNQLGSQPKVPDIQDLTALLEKSWISESESEVVQEHMSKVYEKIDKRRPFWIAKLQGQGQGMEKKQDGNITRTQINLGTIACGGRTDEVVVMLKSAALFSLDAALHVIVFSDDEVRLFMAQYLLELQWTANTMGGQLTFEIHKDWFPGDVDSAWKEMYKKCATQRLFFPSLLSHIDSLIYLDADTIVVSNLTELWTVFSSKMTGKVMAALAQNNENTTSIAYYPYHASFPYILPRGANAGVMLMNLTKLREFKFEEKAMALNTAYREKIVLADQDIINMIFGVFRDEVVNIDCSYNFYWAHCGNGGFICHDEKTGYNECFCKAVSDKGAQIIHGNTGSFFTPYPELAFLPPLYQAFRKLDLLTDSYLEIFGNLRKQFDSFPHRPCAPLTSDDLYRNAERFVSSIGIELPVSNS